MVVPVALEIFRAGTHVDMFGRAVTFSDEGLTMSAAAYDARIRTAPLVIGHPDGDSPSYGQVRRLRRHRDRLVAESEFAPALAELYRRGSYKKVSASFYRPFSPRNPVPGSYYLRHVGFLGAMPPAVKGLAPVTSFSDNQADFQLFELPCLSFAEEIEAFQEQCIENGRFMTTSRAASIVARRRGAL